MWGFKKKVYVLVDLDTKEDILESKVFISKEAVKEDIDNEIAPESSYRLVERQEGKKERVVWTYRLKKVKSPEEIAEKNRDEAEKFLQKDAADIQERVSRHKEFRTKIVKMYGIENVPSDVDNIKMPDGNMGILEAMQLATAQSLYEGIRRRPSDMCDNFFSMMDSGTTILQGLADMLAKKLTDPKKSKEAVDKKETKKEIKIDRGKGKDGTTRIKFQREEEKVSDVFAPDLDMYEEYAAYLNPDKKIEAEEIEEEKEK